MIPEDPGPASVASIKLELEREGYEIFDYIDEKTGDTILMQQYYIAFFKARA